MKMFCENCHKVFNDYESDTGYDDPSPMGVGLPYGNYTYPTCPDCGSDELVEFLCDGECEECNYREYCEEDEW